jgi:2-oxoglutarate ferredoxin oxidoreductase subunit alpha
VIVAELNMGQLRMMIRAQFLVDAIGLNKIQGQPFKVRDVVDAIEGQLDVGRTDGTAVSVSTPSQAIA